MDHLAKLFSATASLAWPLMLGVLLFRLDGPIRTLVESARGRKFTIKVAGNELTMEEASEQQRVRNDFAERAAVGELTGGPVSVPPAHARRSASGPPCAGRTA